MPGLLEFLKPRIDELRGLWASRHLGHLISGLQRFLAVDKLIFGLAACKNEISGLAARKNVAFGLAAQVELILGLCAAGLTVCLAFDAWASGKTCFPVYRNANLRFLV